MRDLVSELQSVMETLDDLDLLHSSEIVRSARDEIERLRTQNVGGNEGQDLVLVPREPMPEMVAAWWRVKNTGSTEPGERGEDRSDYAAYRAMIAAAPAPKNRGAKCGAPSAVADNLEVPQ